mmetsp:Transcript_10293/g.28397  ORF Transcript_10293/g.28397 Transcript_10293/m.28397 type:complete len:203 (-) Transcript_10293:52-660(-)
MLEDHVTIVSSGHRLVVHAHNGQHGQTSIVNLLVLVVHPTFIAVINPVGGSKNIPGNVSRALLDLFGQPFHGSASKEELQPTHKGELLGRFQGIGRQFAIKRRVHTRGGNIPSQAGRHCHTAVLQFGFAVILHNFIRLASGKTQWIKETNGGGNARDGFVLPCRQLGRTSGGLRSGSKSSGRSQKRKESGNLHGEKGCCGGG